MSLKIVVQKVVTTITKEEQKAIKGGTTDGIITVDTTIM